MAEPIVEELHHTTRYWQDQAMKLKQAYDEAKLYNQSISDERESLQDENKGLRTHLKDMETELEFMKQELHSFKIGKRLIDYEFEHEYDFMQHEQELQTEIKNLERMIENNKKLSHGVEVENEYLLSQNKELISKAESLDANKVELQQEIKLLNQEQERLLFLNSELEQENVALQRQLSRVNKLKINVEELQDELIQVKLDYKGTLQKLKATDDDNKRLSAQLEECLNVLNEERNQNKILQTQLVQQMHVPASNISWSAEQLLQTNKNANMSDEESYATTMSFSSSMERIDRTNSCKSSVSGGEYCKADNNDREDGELSGKETLENDWTSDHDVDPLTAKNVSSETSSGGKHNTSTNCFTNSSVIDLQADVKDVNIEGRKLSTINKLSLSVKELYRFSTKNLEIMDNLQCELLCVTDEVDALCRQIYEILRYNDATSQTFINQLKSIPTVGPHQQELIFDAVDNEFKNLELLKCSDNTEVPITEVSTVLISENKKCQGKVALCCELVRNIRLKIDLLLDHTRNKQEDGKEEIQNVCITITGNANECKKLKSLLDAKNEQVATLKLILKTSKATTESEISHIRSKYEREIQKLKNDNAGLKSSLETLQCKDTTYHNVKADFAIKCEEYITKMDSMQKDLIEAEKERKVLNQLLIRTINQKIILTQQLEDLKLEIEDMRIQSLKASDLQTHSLLPRV
ncbi:Protein bicaudal D-like protein 1 [Trichoplax sp. H2]|nr:Protein bicaudal D-like protein 1 [Trichoplax sp. H2]|eukprot:RDD47147.1 Protein bicaudal D-like protein 1 [Trichoplax sp. H2]